MRGGPTLNPKLIIGWPESQFISLEVLYRRYPSDSFDGNWLETDIVVESGTCHGKYRATILVQDFEAFRDRIALLTETWDGTALFDPMEPWIQIKLTGNGGTEIRVSGEADHPCGMGKTLPFSMSISSSELPGIIKMLDDILVRYPAVGML